MPEVRLVKKPIRKKGRPKLILEHRFFDRIMTVLKHNPKSKKSIIRVTGFKKSIVTRIIKILLQNDAIRKIGSRRGTEYKARNDKKANKTNYYYKKEENSTSQECNSDSSSQRNDV